MSLMVGNQRQRNTLHDVNEELLKLKGELDMKESMASLGKFLRYNIRMTVFWLTGVRLGPHQVMMLRAWFQKNYSLNTWGRGSAKSFVVMIFIFLYCIFNANRKIVIVSSNFRNSRRILEEMEKLAKRPEGQLLMRCFKVPKLTKRNDQYFWEFNNGSSATCVPLSGGDGLRGLRANVLIVDEALLVPKTIIDSVLIPFLVANADIGEKLRITELEKKLVKKGILKEEDRTKFSSEAKLILLSSASFTFEDLYKVHLEYLEKIDKPFDLDKKELKITYFVSQMSYEAVPEEFLDQGVIQDALSGKTPQSVIDREYKAQYTDGSEGYFSPKKMKNCTFDIGQSPHVELVGDPNAEYVLAIDPSYTSSDAGDHFAMSLLKIGKNSSGKVIGTLVHSYTVAGGALKDHIKYFKYLLDKFNVVYVVCDTTQGDNFDFINTCNESKLFKDIGLDLKGIDAPFGKGDFEETVRALRQDYNKEAGKIVQKQTFSGSFIRSANEYLQASFDYKWCLFASKVTVDPNFFEKVKSSDIGDILGSHKKLSEFSANKKKMTMSEFIEWQDSLIDLTKTECAYIEVTQSAQGTQTFDLPSNLKRSTNINRIRKDNYSSLLLANWGLHCYSEAMKLEVKSQRTGFSPFLVKNI